MDNSKLPAYPIVLPHPEVDHTRGLTKLEVMTMAAMQGLCANGTLFKAIEQDVNIADPQQFIASMAVQYAKATLSELSKQQ